MTHVHELRQVLLVSTPLGDGVALLHIDYGAQHNGTLLVILEGTGELKYFDTNQVRACRNDTMGINVTDDPQQPYEVTKPINNPVKP